jgi:hypothetical protein
MTLAVGFILCVASPVLAQEAWWIHCPVCGQKLGGTGWYGPYATLEACQAEVRVLRSQGVTAPELPCLNKGPSQPAQENSSFFSALPSGLRGSLLGGGMAALAASLSEREGEEKRRDYEAWIGGGVFAGAFFESLVSPSSSPVVLSLAAAGGAYFAANANGREREAQNLQTAEDTRKQRGLATAAAAVLVGGVALINKATGFRWTPPSSIRRLQLSSSGKAVWVRWSW